MSLRHDPQSATDDDLWETVRLHTPDSAGGPTEEEYCCCQWCFEFEVRWQRFADFQSARW